MPGSRPTGTPYPWPMADGGAHMCPGEQWWQLHSWKEHTHPPYGDSPETWGHRFAPTDEPVQRDAHGQVLMPDDLIERVGRNRTWTRQCYMPPTNPAIPPSEHWPWDWWAGSHIKVSRISR
jgi:hypothetical protein